MGKKCPKDPCHQLEQTPAAGANARLRPPVAPRLGTQAAFLEPVPTAQGVVQQPTGEKTKSDGKKVSLTSWSISFLHSTRKTNTHFRTAFARVGVTCSKLSRTAVRKSVACAGGMHLQTAWREVRNRRDGVTALLQQFGKERQLDGAVSSSVMEGAIT